MRLRILTLYKIAKQTLSIKDLAFSHLRFKEHRTHSQSCDFIVSMETKQGHN